MKSSLFIALLFFMASGGCVAPTGDSASVHGLTAGTALRIHVNPPYGRLANEISMIFEAGQQANWPGLDLTQSYGVLISKPLFSEYFLDLSEPQDLRRSMALETFRVLGDQVANATLGEHLVWLPTNDQPHGLGRSDIYATAMLLPIHLGRQPGQWQFGDFLALQTRGSDDRMHIDWRHQGATVLSLDFEFDDGLFPARLMVVPAYQFVPPGEQPGGAWTITRVYEKRGLGSPLNLGAVPFEPTLSSELTDLIVVEAPTPGASVVVPPTESPPSEVQFAEALQAAIRSPQQMQASSTQARQILCGYIWERDRFVFVDAQGQSADPTGTASHRHQFAFASLPLQPGIVQATGVLIQEHEVQAKPLVPPAGFLVTGGNGVCGAYVVGDQPRSFEPQVLALPDAVIQFQDLAPVGAEIDVVQWDLGVIGEVTSQAYWIIQSGCHVGGKTTPTTLIIQAWTGEPEYYFQGGVPGVAACGLGTYPPVR